MKWRFILVAVFLGPVLPSKLIAGPTTRQAVLDCAIIQDRSSGLTLPEGSQVYIFGMCTGGARATSPFRHGPASVQVKNRRGRLAVELAVCQSAKNDYKTRCTGYIIGGCGVSGYSHMSAVYATTTAGGARSASVSFKLNYPALIVVMGFGASENHLKFDGMPGLKMAAQGRGGELASCIADAACAPGDYTVSQSSDSPARTALQAEALGVFAFSDRPDAMESADQKLDLSPVFTAPEAAPVMLAESGSNRGDAVTIVAMPGGSNGGISASVIVCVAALAAIVLIITLLGAITAMRKRN
ncbi:MAG TPA: hypothetical protein VMD30_12260 [Tepidisphaeraceae bacterium]|nr:hypothetical protein [Tepidisphaeraceae bacterium]